MRNRLFSAFAILSFLALPVSTATKTHAQDTSNFKFDSFSADYWLTRSADGSSRLEVKEELVARFPDFDQNHGILRAIPDRYQNHTLSLKVLSVTDASNNPHTYTTYSENDNTVIKIGDADTYVKGLVTYKINYQMADVISFQAGHDEFFWDINGDQWAQPFASVSARVHISGSLAQQLNDNQVCLAGFFGGNQQPCEISRQASSEGTLVTASASNLSPGQTLSLALSFKPGTFTKSEAVQREEFLNKVSIVAAIVAGLGLPLAAFAFMFRRWRQFGDDPKGRGVIIPEYEPPKGLDALSSDYLYKQALRPEAISAMLIELAVHGFINIYEIPKKGIFGKKDYELELKKVPAHASPPVKNALTAIFGDLKAGIKAKMSDFKLRDRQTKMYDEMKKLESDLAHIMHIKGYFIKNPKAVKTGYQIWSGIILAAGVLIAVAAGSTGVFAVGGIAAGFILAAVVVFMFSHLMPARTEPGVQAYDALLGLKDYIKMAEAERLRYLQSPEGAEKIHDADSFDPKTAAAKVKLFEELLPYAMLFGLEKQWAKQFEGIYTHAPGWYRGDWTAFNAAYLGSSIGDFRGFSSATFTTPSSSGSGFSGGGAGGGGGGGGGGGW